MCFELDEHVVCPGATRTAAVVPQGKTERRSGRQCTKRPELVQIAQVSTCKLQCRSSLGLLLFVFLGTIINSSERNYSYMGVFR